MEPVGLSLECLELWPRLNGPPLILCLITCHSSGRLVNTPGLVSLATAAPTAYLRNCHRRAVTFLARGKRL